MKNYLVVPATLAIFGFLNLVQNPPFLSSVPQSLNQDDSSSQDGESIRSVLTDYLEGANKGDLARLRSTFASQAVILYSRGGELWNVPLEEFLKNVTSGNIRVPRRVLMVDVFGTAAAAKIESAFPDGLAMDYVSLLKISGQWRIVSKILASSKKGSFISKKLLHLRFVQSIHYSQTRRERPWNI